MEDGSVSPFKPRSAPAGCLWERFGTGKINSHVGSRGGGRGGVGGCGEERVLVSRKIKKSFEVSECKFKSFSRDKFMPYGR